jgi:hypothetical protein
MMILIRLFVKEFISLMTPNKTIKDVTNPDLEGMPKANEVYNDMLNTFDKFFPPDQENNLMANYISQTILKSRKILNISLNKFILNSDSNFLANNLLFKSPQEIFVNQKEIPIQDASDMYKDALLEFAMPEVPMGIREGGFLFHLQKYMEDIATKYDNLLKELNIPHAERLMTSFHNSKDLLVTNARYSIFYITPDVHLSIRNGITQYLTAMSEHPLLVNLPLFNKTTKYLNIRNLTEIYKAFSIDRDKGMNYTVETEVFVITESNKGKNSNKLLRD